MSFCIPRSPRARRWRRHADVTVACSRRACSPAKLKRRMVRWYHAIFTAYGFWLPNDPRGSWSTFVGSWELYKFGPATKTNQRCSLAHEPHNVNERLAAKKALKYPPVRFDACQRDAIAAGIGRACRESEIQFMLARLATITCMSLRRGIPSRLSALSGSSRAGPVSRCVCRVVIRCNALHSPVAHRRRRGRRGVGRCISTICRSCARRSIMCGAIR